MIRRTPRIMLTGTAAFGGFAIVAWFLGSLLRLRGADLWILRGGLWLLGGIAVVLIVWFLLKRRRRGRPVRDEIDTSFSHARKRLAAARLEGTKKLRAFPVILLVGPEGSAKTTTLLRSGLEPDLLAGEVFRGDAVAPTPAANVWYVRQTIMVEAGGTLLGEPSRWSRLIHHIRAPRLAAVLAGRPQAPRVAVVCYSCEDLARSDAAEVVAASARALRERLMEVSRSLGIRLPVYVVFTKADRLRCFSEFVRNLADEETRQVLGATLRTPPPSTAGSYADREYRRVSDAFEELLQSLAQQRLRMLPRDTDVAQRALAYEFPRELRKITPLATQFLVELCKPRQLELSPFLRGFYFAGVRAVLVEAAVRPAPVTPDVRQVGATQVLRPDEHRAPPPQAPPAAAGTRRVPQWLFLSDLFHRVILRDKVALGVTQSGYRLKQLRRVAFATLAAVAVLLTLGFTVSFIANRRLEARVGRAARAVNALGPSESVSTALAGLEDLRLELDRLTRYQRGGPPLRLRWGLYTGTSLARPARSVYWRAFQDAMLGGIRDSLLTELRAVTANPERSTFARVHRLLANHLVTTSRPDRLTEDTAAALLGYWPDTRRLGDADRERAGSQLLFYGGGLCTTDLCAVPHDPNLSGAACRALAGLSDEESVYQSLLTRGAAASSAIRFDDEWVVNPHVIPAAFTADGWTAIHAEFDSGDLSPGGERWVFETIGCESLGQQNMASLVGTLRARYEGEYAQQWRTFLRSAQVRVSGGVSGAARSIAALGGNRSPLLRMLADAAANTDTTLDSTFARGFQPVHAVTPPPIGDQLIVDQNREYTSQLGELGRALERAARDREDAAAREEALSQARRAREVASQLVSTFSGSEEAAEVSGDVRRLIENPIVRVERMLEGAIRAGPRNRVNASGSAFCRDFSRLIAKYPFSPSGRDEATIAEVADIFHPQDGLLMRLNSDELGNAMVRRAGRWGRDPSAAVQPESRFVQFFRRAAAVSETLFDDQGAGPRLGFALQLSPPAGASAVTVALDGRPATFTQTVRTSVNFQWVGERARDVLLRVTVGGQNVDLLRFSGPWALFRLFQEAQWEQLGQRYRVIWSLEPQTGSRYVVEGQITPVGDPILNPGYMSGLTCVSQIVR
jgi:type VI secretion system protein ImpL